MTLKKINLNWKFLPMLPLQAGGAWSASKGGAHGWWPSSEKACHINVLELKAIFLGLDKFASNLKNCNILIRSENTTAVAYINKMGSVKFIQLNNLARRIWQWAEKRNIWLVAVHIKSEDNYMADKESRRLPMETEWSLADYAFALIMKEFGRPEVDLFASSHNFKCPNFVSWRGDKGSIATDAFTIPWTNLFFYAFPPFPLVLRTLQKIISDKAEGIIVVPNWPSQSWFPLFLRLKCSKLLIFEPNEKLLFSHFSKTHPLASNLSLAVAKLSGKHFA